MCERQNQCEKKGPTAFITVFGNFDLEKLFARSSEFQATFGWAGICHYCTVPSYTFFYNDIKMVRKYIALGVKRETETKNETNGPIC